MDIAQSNKEVENIKNTMGSEEGVLVMMALLEGLSYNVLSSDVWQLSLYEAFDIAVNKYKIDPSAAQDMLQRILTLAKNKGKENPIRNMF